MLDGRGELDLVVAVELAHHLRELWVGPSVEVGDVVVQAEPEAQPILDRGENRCVQRLVRRQFAAQLGLVDRAGAGQ
jgi:hypothetical protein